MTTFGFVLVIGTWTLILVAALAALADMLLAVPMAVWIPCDECDGTGTDLVVPDQVCDVCEGDGCVEDDGDLADRGHDRWVADERGAL